MQQRSWLLIASGIGAVVGVGILANVPTQVTFTKDITIAAPLEAVYQHLADPNKILDAHPLIVEIANVSTEVDSDGVEHISFSPTDEWKVFGRSIRMTYQAESVLRQPPKHLYSIAHAPSNIVVETSTSLTPVDGGTLVHQDVLITTPILFAAFTKQQASSSRQHMLEHMKDYLE